MKIAILADFPTSALDGGTLGRGGGQGSTWLPQLALSFREYRDLEIHWLILDRTVYRTQVIESHGQYFHRIPAMKFSLDLALNYLPARFVLGREIRCIKPDIVHAWGTETIYAAALSDCRCSTILSMQGILTEYNRVGGLPHSWRWRKMISSEPAFIRAATVITSESEWGIDKVNSTIQGKEIHKIEYGVDPSYYEVTWQPTLNEPRILFVGTLSYLKGIDIILDMLKRNPDRNWKMVFVGDGEFADALRKLNDPKVEVLGMLKTKQVQHEMSKAWALIMPSRADTSPNVVKEARVIGLPVVGSPNGGHAEYIEHDKDGMLVENESPEAWHSALNRLATDFELCKQMGEAKHTYFREYFSPQNTAEQFAKLYRELLKRNTP